MACECDAEKYTERNFIRDCMENMFCLKFQCKSESVHFLINEEKEITTKECVSFKFLIKNTLSMYVNRCVLKRM